MHAAKQIMEQAGALPVEERAALVDSLLKSLTPVDAEVDRAWVAAAQRRLDEIEAGNVIPIPAEAVFREARERLQK